MNAITKNKLLVIIPLLLLALTATACGGKDKVDELLDRYEKFVVKSEDLAVLPSVSMEDAQALMDDANNFSKQVQQNFSADTKMNDTQTKRYQDLTNRLMKALQTIQTRNAN